MFGQSRHSPNQVESGPCVTAPILASASSRGFAGPRFQSGGSRKNRNGCKEGDSRECTIRQNGYYTICLCGESPGTDCCPVLGSVVSRRSRSERFSKHTIAGCKRSHVSERASHFVEDVPHLPAHPLSYPRCAAGHAAVLGARCQNVLLRVESWTESSVLRLSRRRFNTLRPPGLLIRLRKPCVRNRLRTFGCQVRFGIFSLSK